MLRALPALLSCAVLVGGCATLSVPSPSELEAFVAHPAGLVTSGAPVVLPPARYPLHAFYATQLEGKVTRLEPTHQVWAVTATATSEITGASDGALAWKVIQMNAQATLDGAPQTLSEDQKRTLLQDYRLDRYALEAPKRALSPGETWTNEIPIVRLAGDGTRTTGVQSEVVTFLGTVPAGGRARGVLQSDVRMTTRTDAPNGAPVIAVSSHAVRQVEIDLDTGTVEVDATHRHEFARSGQGATETDGTVRHDRKP